MHCGISFADDGVGSENLSEIGGFAGRTVISEWPSVNRAEPLAAPAMRNSIPSLNDSDTII
jgi:hypothetical protein